MANDRVIMAREVGLAWLLSKTSVEYKIRILSGGKDYKNLVNLLRSWKKGQVHFDGVTAAPDLTIHHLYDIVIVRSANKDCITRLSHWLTDHGIEHSGLC